MPKTPFVFDGHNDVIFRLWEGGGDVVARFRAEQSGHIDLEKARKGGLAGGFFALFAPPLGKFSLPGFEPPYDHPLPPMLDQKDAVEVIAKQAGILCELDRAGVLKICRRRAEIDAAMANGTMAAIMHLEGAEAVDPDFRVLDLLYASGLRSLGPVWSRPTIWGHGVPFRFPSDGDAGPGLTDAGKALVQRCAEMGIIFDTSHLNVAGFMDVAQAGVPIVATHSNACAVSPGARNLTDAQLTLIGQTRGMVGLNFGTMFLREDGRKAPEGGIEAAIRHLSHMIDLAGEDHVGLGSDFDGAPMPAGLETAAGLDALRQAMRDHQFGEKLIKKVCHGNWLDFISRALG